MHFAYLVLLNFVPLAVAFRLCVAYAAGLDVRDGNAIVMCTAAVILNWIANTGFVVWSGDTDPEMMFLGTDIVSLAVVVASSPAVWAQQLSGTYIGQIIMHFIHIVGQGDAWNYWAILTALGLLQLLLLAAWSFTTPTARDAVYDSW